MKRKYLMPQMQNLLNLLESLSIKIEEKVQTLRSSLKEIIDKEIFFTVVEDYTSSYSSTFLTDLSLFHGRDLFLKCLCSSSVENQSLLNYLDSKLLINLILETYSFLSLYSFLNSLNLLENVDLKMLDQKIAHFIKKSTKKFINNNNEIKKNL